MEGQIALGEMPTTRYAVNTRSVLMIAMLACVLIGFGAGVYAQLVGHHHAFATTREMPWGMLIGAYAYLAIISTGLCLVAVISHLFHLDGLAPLANRMVWLSIVTLLGAFTIIGLEIENPWKMPLGVLLHPNLTSNIWWMGTLYGLAMGILFVELLLLINNKVKIAIAIGLLGAVTEMLANTNLGSVFASLNARPFWYGSQLPIFFLASALLSGLAAVILFTYTALLFNSEKITENTRIGLRNAGKFLAVMIFFISLATAWKYANAYCGTEELRCVADALISGPLASSFWGLEIGVGLLLPFFLLVLTRCASLRVLVLAAVLALVGQFFSRYNLVVAGSIFSVFSEYEAVPSYISYSPTVVECLVLVGGLGVVGVGFLAGESGLSELFRDKQEQREAVAEQSGAIEQAMA